ASVRSQGEPALCAPGGAARPRFTRTLLGGRELLVAQAVRLLGVGAETALAVRLVVLVVAFEPHHAALVLEREHVRRDPIEEPAVVADHHRTARELEQAVLERA